MSNINALLARAAALRDETALNSISPERAGGIMYDTLLALNELWLQQGAALVISKIYASVASMQADTAPVSDLTGQPLRPGQIVVIASSDSDNGTIYRYNGTSGPSWTAVGEMGGMEPVDSLDSDSTTSPLAARQGKVLDGKVSQLGQEVDDLIESSYGEVVTEIVPGYWDTRAIKGVGIGETYIGTLQESNSNYSAKFQVAKGDFIEIKGRGTVAACSLCLLTDLNNKTNYFSGELDARATPLKLIVSEDGYAYVNFYEYDAQTEYVKHTAYLKSINDRIDDLEESIDECNERFDNLDIPQVADNLETDDDEQALSARQGKVIGDILYGTETETDTPIQLDIDTYYNTGDARTTIGAQQSASGYASILLDVVPGEQYIIKGASSSGATRLYCFADSSKAFTFRSSDMDTRQNPLTITIPSGVAYMVCNFPGYNPQTDGLVKKETEETKGLIEKVNDLEKLPWYGKTIVLFGDSIAEGQRYFDTKERFSDWIERYTGATVINIAVGGAKIRQHRPPMEEPGDVSNAYFATQIYDMVVACCTGDFTYQDAAGEYLPYYVGEGKAFTLMQTIDWANVSAVIIHGGGNDWFNSPKVGEPGSTDITTTCGAINEINRLLSTTYPHLSIYWVAPSIRKIRIERENEPGVYDYYYCDENYSRVGNTLPEFIAKMMDSAKIKNTPCLDMYHTMGWNQYSMIYYFPNSANTDPHFDGTHPHNGYKEMARHIVGFMMANRSFK